MSMEKKTWQEFLSGCSSAVLSWDSLDSLKVFGKDGTTCIVQISIHDYLADHTAFDYKEEQGKSLVRWDSSEWTEIVNWDEDPAIYLKVYKEFDGKYHTDGRFYFDLREATEEKEKCTDGESTDAPIQDVVEAVEAVKLLYTFDEIIPYLRSFIKQEITLIPLLGYTKGNKETGEERYKAAKKPIANNARNNQF